MTNRLAYRLILWVTAFSLVLTLFGTGLRTYLDYKEAIGSIEEDFKKIRAGIVPSISASLWVMDREQLKVQMDGILNFPHFSQAEIESKGRMIVSSGSPKPGRSMRQEFPLYHTYKNKAISLGSLSVSANTESIHTTVFNRFYERLFRQAVQIFFISLFVLFIVRFLVIKRLGTMAAYVRELRPDRLDKPLVPMEERRREGQDELDQVAAAINSMSADLRNAFRELDVELNKSRLAEEAFKRVSHQNELILNAAGEGIFGLDLNGNHTFVNPAAAKMLGYEPDELIGKHSHSTWHHTKTDGTPYPEQECPIYSAFKDGAVHHRRDEVFWKKDNTAFNVTYTSTPIIDNKKIVGAVVTFSDITGRKQSEAALRKSEEEYRTLFEESKDVVFFSTPEGRFIDINQAGVELFGHSSKEELLEADIERDLYVHLGYRKELLKILYEQGYVKDYELLMKNKKGDILIVLETATALRDKTGRVTAYRGMLRDITHQRKLEQQLMQAQKMEAVGQLAGGIAHDFNNFLTAIIGYGSILQMGMDKDNALTAHVRQILSSAERAASLTKQLLIFSRQQIIDPRPVKINEIIFAIEKLLSRLIGEDIELKLTLSPEDLTVRADICQMEQVLMNLATNARDAMPNGGKLMIKTESVVMDDELMMTRGCGKEGPYVVLTVSDTGEGMDEKTRERIFEPFFTTKEVGKGTGLGLAIIYGIVKQHNGCINVYSEPGEGTSFRIYLPLIEDVVEEKMTSAQPDAIGGTETVLLTEDDSEVREMMSGLLADFGYTVIEAIDGEDAVERFKEHKDSIQLLILDVIMPKKNGKEVYNEVVQIKPEVKVIFASGYPAEVIRRKGIIEEGVEFISKPFAPSEFLKTIRKVLQQ